MFGRRKRTDIYYQDGWSFPKRGRVAFGRANERHRQIADEYERRQAHKNRR